MSLEKGFQRLTLILSLVAGPLVFFYLLVVENSFDLEFDEFFFVLLAFEINGCFAVWIIYLVVRWIVKGFREDKQKDEQKQSINRNTQQQELK